MADPRDEERELLAVHDWRWMWCFDPEHHKRWCQEFLEWEEWCAQWGLDPR